MFELNPNQINKYVAELADLCKIHFRPSTVPRMSKRRRINKIQSDNLANAMSAHQTWLMQNKNSNTIGGALHSANLLIKFYSE